MIFVCRDLKIVISEDEKTIVRGYYKEYEENLIRKKQMLAREASIQMTYQLILVVYQFFNFPAIELLYSEYSGLPSGLKILGSPTAQWVNNLFLQLFSLLTSIYTMLEVPLKVFLSLSYDSYGMSFSIFLLNNLRIGWLSEKWQ